MDSFLKHLDKEDQVRVKADFLAFMKIVEGAGFDLSGLEYNDLYLRNKVKICDLKTVIRLIVPSQKLLLDIPRLKHMEEFISLNKIIGIAQKIMAEGENQFKRVDYELKKRFLKDADLSVQIPTAEFKETYLAFLEVKTLLELELLNIEEIFVESVLRWMVAKSGFIFIEGTTLKLKAFRSQNTAVYKWLCNRLYRLYIRKQFEVEVPSGKLRHKYLFTRSDKFGQKLDLKPYEIVVFESGLSELKTGKYIEGKKVNLDNASIEYLITTEYVSLNRESVYSIQPENIHISIPVYLGFVKAKIPSIATATKTG